MSPVEIVPAGVHVTEHVVGAAKEPVLVGVLRDGGLISYRKPDGTYIHTLDSREGFKRKLQQTWHPAQNRYDIVTLSRGRRTSVVRPNRPQGRETAVRPARA